MATIIKDQADLMAHVGQHLGYSEYITVTQEQVQLFADATGDHQWIHLDTERAKSGPFGQTIAHGYLTLSLAPVLIGQIWKVEGVKMGVNYGTNKVRFMAPVPEPKLYLKPPLNAKELTSLHALQKLSSVTTTN